MQRGGVLIPKGYYAENIIVNSKDLKSQTSATATADDILAGKTAWVNGSKIIGTATFEDGTVPSNEPMELGASGWLILNGLWDRNGQQIRINVPENVEYHIGVRVSVRINGVGTYVSAFHHIITYGRTSYRTKTIQMKASGDPNTYNITLGWWHRYLNGVIFSLKNINLPIPNLVVNQGGDIFAYHLTNYNK